MKVCFVKPTVLVSVGNDMTIAQEEIFGPVLSVVAYDSEYEAVRIMVDVAVRGTVGHRGPVFENRDIRAMALRITARR